MPRGRVQGAETGAFHLVNARGLTKQCSGGPLRLTKAKVKQSPASTACSERPGCPGTASKIALRVCDSITLYPVRPQSGGTCTVGDRQWLSIKMAGLEREPRSDDTRFPVWAGIVAALLTRLMRDISAIGPHRIL